MRCGRRDHFFFLLREWLWSWQRLLVWYWNWAWSYLIFLHGSFIYYGQHAFCNKIRDCVFCFPLFCPCLATSFHSNKSIYVVHVVNRSQLQIACIFLIPHSLHKPLIKCHLTNDSTRQLVPIPQVSWGWRTGGQHVLAMKSSAQLDSNWTHALPVSLSRTFVCFLIYFAIALM